MVERIYKERGKRSVTKIKALKFCNNDYILKRSLSYFNGYTCKYY